MQLGCRGGLIAILFSVGVAWGEEPYKHAWGQNTGNNLPLAVLEDPQGRPYFYCSQKSGGFAVYKISLGRRCWPDLEETLPISKFQNLDVTNITHHGDYLFLSLGDFFKATGSKAGLAVVSIRSPDKPELVGIWTSPKKTGGCAAVVTDGKYAYLGGMEYGVTVLNVTNPADPQHVATFLPDIHFPRKNPKRLQHPNARGLALVGNKLYVAYDAGGLRVLDVSNPATPKEIGRYVNTAMGTKPQAFNNLVIVGKLAYVAVDYAGMEVLDISDPARIRQVSWLNPWSAETKNNNWFNSPGHTNQLAYYALQNRIFLSAGDSEMLVVDVKDPANPKIVFQKGTPKNRRGVWGVALGQQHVYLTYIKTMLPFRSSWSGVVAHDKWTAWQPSE